MSTWKNNFNMPLHQNGFAALFLTILVLIVAGGIAVSLAFLDAGEQRALRNIILAEQSYYAAEAGIEDALLRLKNGWNAPSSYSFSIENTTVEVGISDIIGGSRTITAKGNALGRVRVVEAVYEITSTDVQFFFGAHVGDGGLQLDNQSEVLGNVFSNGDVSMGNNAGIGGIFAGVPGSVKIAKVGGRLYCTSGCGGPSPPFVNGDATVDICKDIWIVGNLIANTSNGCGDIDTLLGTPPDPIPLPLDDPAVIQGWKDAAEAGGTIEGDYTVQGFTTASLGPKKITGNLTLGNQATLIVKGTLWVLGNITLDNGAQVRLDAGYGSTSGVIVADGKIHLDNNSDSSGSGETGSYLMYLSTSTDTGDEAITLDNNAQADILYTNNGTIKIDNNARLREAVGYRVHLEENASLAYESGLQSVHFVNGTGGGWSVRSWEEVE